MADKKYYWLKLKKDFFKRHDIQIIENMPNGKDYVLFYLKLLVESVDHEGGLRFNETIPYNEQMLATITNTNIDTVSNAMKLFRELGMVEILDDETIYMNEVSKMLGTETYWAQKKREEREKKKLPKPAMPQIGQCPIDVQGKSNVSKQEIEIELDIEKELEKDKDKKKKKKPADANFTSLFSSYTTNQELIETLNDFVAMRIKIKEPATERAMKSILTRLNQLAQNDEEKIQILENAIVGNWKGVWPLNHQQRGNMNARPITTNGNYDSSGLELF
ncbi:phage replisome organizer N-terminal domain-containing protein [Turicibacter sanguinis]|uniref:phage replisome organizer N-terminal domain-containing protein n=1 Tax=Turicibacter sanguinis TaxID=154288 RepID=UPI0021D510CB|nr:phage replisome organizer N-terminal domain-containing protein [Turicibacter sanguinis]MCU7195519.1 phage replisome organizer N-terminal domain-containing protein [Turicibacter sanguinis]